MGVVVAYGTMALFSIASTLLSLFGLLLVLRFAYRFITAPAGGRAAASRAPAAFEKPAAAVSIAADLGRTAAMSQPDPTSPGGSAADPAVQERALSAERLFDVRRDSHPLDTIATIATWRATTPAQGLRAAWYAAILLVFINGLQLIPLAFPGPQFEVGAPGKFEGSDKLIELVITAIVSGIELGLAAILQKWRARWAGTLLLAFALCSLIEAGTPPYHYIMATIIVAAVIAVASKLVFSGLEGASAYRRGVALDTQGDRAWAKTPWLLGLIALLLAAASTYATSYGARSLASTDEQGTASGQTAPAQQRPAQTPASVAQAPETPTAASTAATATAPQPPTANTNATTAAEWAAFLSPSDPEWARYPALPLSEPPKAPKLVNGDPEYRTRINEAAAEGVNFGGVAHILQFGCGTECSVAMIINLSTGEVDDFPNGGEDYSQLTLLFNPRSRLIRSTWKTTEGDDSYCLGQAFVWEYGRVRAVGPQLRSPEPTDGGCPGGQA